jgi:hypothetical protein
LWLLLVAVGEQTAQLAWQNTAAFRTEATGISTGAERSAVLDAAASRDKMRAPVGPYQESVVRAKFREN